VARPRRLGRDVEADAVVGDPQHEAVTLFLDCDDDLGRLRVLARVRDRLLCDPVENRTEAFRRLRTQGVLESKRGGAVGLRLVEICAESRDEAFAVERGRPQLEQEMPKARDRSDKTQLEQVLLNLVVNARDAMPGGGRIEIEIDEVDVGPDHSLELEPGRFALLAVSDTGVGIDAQTVGQIFEPFFTTKSEGTGLGLATVYGIVRQSGGTIWVYSEPGSGTVFKIYLPLAAEAIASAAVEPPARVPDGAGEHVLVIEDDRQVRSIVKQMLVRRGYSVVTADGPEAALAAAAADARFDAILSDLVMPNGGGRELVAQLVASQPDAAVVFMSGYSDDAVRTRGVVDPGTAFIEKPFSSDDLVLLLRQTISGRREAA